MARLPAALDSFAEIWVCDAEFRQAPGHTPWPICCICALELRSGREASIWAAEGSVQPPWDNGPSTLIVGHALMAEFASFLALGWQLPAYAIDTWVEARRRWNGLPAGSPAECGLLKVAARFGIATIADAEKAAGRALAMRGGDWSEQEQRDLMRYCMSDVQATAAVFLRLLESILGEPGELGRALLRGRYVRAAAKIERVGIPFDVALYRSLKEQWDVLRRLLVEEVNERYGVYVEGSFNHQKFAELIERLGLSGLWPRTPTGRLATSDRTMKDAARAYPELQELRELMATLSQLRQLDLPVGADGRHRPGGWFIFGTETARAAPKKFIFTAATWVRGLIRPDPGQALIYSDYKSQELVVAAHLSDDENLKHAIASGDAYIWFGKKVGLMPEDATDKTHPHLRDKMKPILLGSNYGLTAHGARIQTGFSYAEAEQLLERHKNLFPRHWAWAHDTIYGAGERLEISSRWGWRVAVTNGSNPRSLQNHPVQTAGAHILHFAVIGLEQVGVETNATVHDAVLTSCKATDISDHCTEVERQMVRAAEVALGSAIQVDHKATIAPHRFDDRRGRSMFQRVIRLRGGLEGLGGQRG